MPSSGASKSNCQSASCRSSRVEYSTSGSRLRRPAFLPQPPPPESTLMRRAPWYITVRVVMLTCFDMFFDASALGSHAADIAASSALSTVWAAQIRTALAILAESASLGITNAHTLTVSGCRSNASKYLDTACSRSWEAGTSCSMSCEFSINSDFPSSLGRASQVR